MEHILGADERSVEKNGFTSNLVLAWLKTNLSLTNKRMIGETPNTLFGLFPLGKKQITYPLRNISSVGVSTKFHIGRFFLGLVFFTGFGFATITNIIYSALSIFFFASSYTTSLNITSNSGSNSFIEMSILEKEKAESFANKINKCISEC